MNIIPVNTPGSHRSATVIGLNAKRIETILGFPANVEDDPYKVKYSWGFTVDGVLCGVWDYKGSHEVSVFSAYGPKDVLQKVFGKHVS